MNVTQGLSHTFKNYIVCVGTSFYDFIFKSKMILALDVVQYTMDVYICYFSDFRVKIFKVSVSYSIGICFTIFLPN